ncbi:ribosomal protein S6--L-glutamate ligase [Allopseudospirillum japonicum]|uniref:Ribosomal protein S6--L-glutamate ligase n=1 Tax=Allopseudospirillum japonicum TaxID=64971 RepID=A0A1H6QZ08_9GAMM|nr:hypothetical protein [Allopseudospirillum japonicum]SEI44710.1 ribosomal protein S6--L-glutamate ligase [Allopseudospirillum japonicum]
MKLISFDALRTLNFPAHTYIKPELYLAHLEAIQDADWLLFPEYWQLPALHFALGARIFPSYASYALGHSKIEMTRAFSACAPEHLPFTLIKANTDENAELIWQQMPLPFVAKIPKSARGQGVFLIETRADWQAYLAMTPCLYAQEYLPLDRDLRLIVIGHKVVGGYWRIQPEGGFHTNIAQGGQVMAGTLPTAAVDLVERVSAQLDIDHAGFDVAMLGQYPYLLEFNRIFGTQGVQDLYGDFNQHILTYLFKQTEHDPSSPNSPNRPRDGRKRPWYPNAA